MNRINKDTLLQVEEFHKLFEHPILESPKIPSEERCNLRYNLLHEEVEEFKQGLLNKDIIEAADAICDIMYVLNGAILELGLKDIFYELFAEVQRSNMSKACKTTKEAHETMKYYEDKDGTKSYYSEKDGLYLVYREGDNKTLKSINYSPVDLKSIIEKHK